MRAAETIAVEATPRGPGGIASVLVIGRNAHRAVRRAGIRTCPEPAYTAVLDGILAAPVPDPPWRIPTVELTCHGGAAAPRALMARLGLRAGTMSEVLHLAVRRRLLEATRAEALDLLRSAPTGAAAAMLLRQSEGALARAVSGMTSPADAARLLRTARAGRALVEPPRVVLAGRPNAGKSTLFNALLGRDRALVADRPGTTRDPVEDLLVVGEFALRLVDTAGLMEAAAGADRGAVEMAREESLRSDLVVRVRDATVPEAPVPSGLRVAAKTDLPRARAKPGEIGVSARKGRGLDRLRRALVSALGLALPRGACVFTARQQALLEEIAAGAPLARVRRRLLWT